MTGRVVVLKAAEGHIPGNAATWPLDSHPRKNLHLLLCAIIHPHDLQHTCKQKENKRYGEIFYLHNTFNSNCKLKEIPDMLNKHVRIVAMPLRPNI